MNNSQDQSEKQEKTSESSQLNKTEASSNAENKKERFKFKKEDMYEITYNF
ncbi:MAG: hypothetical protein ACRC80_22070 [Waterburya sp.]